MWEIREKDLTLEEEPGGLVLHGWKIDVLPAGWDIHLTDEELQRLGDAIDEYFAGSRL